MMTCSSIVFFQRGKFNFQSDEIKSRGILDAFNDLYSTGNSKEYERRIEVSDFFLAWLSYHRKNMARVRKQSS